jgi:hypothetical protein
VDPNGGERHSDSEPFGALPDDGSDDVDPQDALDFDDDLPDPGSSSALPPKVEAWRKRSATGAVLTGFALGLQQVFEKEKEQPAIIMQTSGDPPSDLPVEADVEHGRPRQSVVSIRPWLLPDRGDQADDAGDPGGAVVGENAGAGDPTGAVAGENAGPGAPYAATASGGSQQPGPSGEAAGATPPPDAGPEDA